MGPEAAKSCADTQLIALNKRPAQRARQELDYGRRGKGDVLWAFAPATGAVLTWTAAQRTTANFVAFLEQTEAWLDPGSERIYAILDNLSAHRAREVLLFALAHPRWEVVFQPQYAAYLNLIEPWWKILRALARKGQRFETWVAICAAIEAATVYGHAPRLAHRHPFIWGRRRRHRPRRQPGIACLPSTR
jgi:hypothetical protein